MARYMHIAYVSYIEIRNANSCSKVDEGCFFKLLGEKDAFERNGNYFGSFDWP